MTRLALPIGLGLAARDDIDDVVGWARDVRDAGPRFDLDPRLATSSATRSATRLRSPGRSSRTARRGGRLPGRPRRGQPVHAPSGRPGHDRFGARRDACPAASSWASGPACRSGSSRWASPTTPDGRARGRLDGDRPDPPAVGAASGCRRPRRACRRSSRCSRRPIGSRSTSPPTASEFVTLAGQKADGYLARPAESIPSLRGILERLRLAATEAGRDPARDRDRPATSCRSSTRRGARRSTGRSASRS